MNSFRPDKLDKLVIPVATGWLMGVCMEARGKQDLWLRREPEVLATLRERAIIQSAESSNRIEGVTVEADRLRPIILGKSRPRDRSEEEVVGYRKALNWIFTSKREIRVAPETIKRLHALAQGGFSGDAGQWKSSDNEIIEVLPDGRRKVRFKTTPAKETPEAIDQLCLAYSDVCAGEALPPLLAAASFVFDFLCIHPFRDGNGRVSRLLTTLLLQRHGFIVGRYVSLERIVEESKESYYENLARSSDGWRRGRHDLVPWWNYFLTILKSAYREFESQVEALEGGATKSDLIRRAVLEMDGPFSLSEIRARCPSVSVQLIKKVLGRMKEDGKVAVEGRGRGARWERS